MKTKRKLSKAVALCLTLLLAFGMLGTTAFAKVTPTSTGTITVSVVEDNLTVSVYQLMTVKVNDNGQPQEPVYTWTDVVASWVRTNYPDKIGDTGYIGSNGDNSVKSGFSNTANTTDIATFYDALAAAIRDGTITPFEPAKTATTSDGAASITDLTMGNYLILIENGMKVYSPSAVNLVPEWKNGEWQMSDATVEVKSSELTIIKTVNDKGADNASMGDTVTFDIVTDVPNFPASAIAKNYAISDTLPNGLTFNGDSLKVYGVTGDSEVQLTGETGGAYTQGDARPNSQGASTFTLTFDYAQISSYDQIHVTYTATLNGTADVGAPGNINTAYLDYTNNPYTETSWQSQSDSATVYTYGLDISKVDADNKDALTGAVFELYATGDDANSGSNKIYFVRDSDGVYHKAASGTDGAVTSLTVNAEGKLTLNGLDERTWYLKEITAPNGYNLLAGPVSVEIADNDLDGAVTVDNAEDNAELDTGLVPLTVENDDGFRLPVTGGMGTILFTAVGVVLMGAAVILLVIALKRKKAENE